jgi:hypothetical protein
MFGLSTAGTEFFHDQHTMGQSNVDQVHHSARQECSQRIRHPHLFHHDALEFLQLVYLWAHMSKRQPGDPFLSHRSRAGRLTCLVYTQVCQAITNCANDFGLNPKWFKPHCIRMASPTALRAAGGSDGQILNLGRWKSVPTSLVYQGSSTTSNNRVLQLIADPTLFTSSDIVLSRVLPPTKANRQHTVRRF